MEEPFLGGDNFMIARQRVNPLMRRSKSSLEMGYVNDDLLPRSEFIFHTHFPSFKRVAIFLILYSAIGTICFYFLRDQIEGEKINGILDSVYFCIVMITTIGYGDLVPSSIPTKLLSYVFSISRVVLVGLIVCRAGDHLVEKQQRMFIDALDARRETCLDRRIKSDSIRIKRLIESEHYRCFLTMFVLVVFLIVGMVFLVTVEKVDLVNAFYCVCTTLTTLGYGDMSFLTKPSRILAIFWILANTICMVKLLWYLTEISMEGRSMSFKWYLNQRQVNSDVEF